MVIKPEKYNLLDSRKLPTYNMFKGKIKNEADSKISELVQLGKEILIYIYIHEVS